MPQESDPNTYIDIPDLVHVHHQDGILARNLANHPQTLPVGLESQTSLELEVTEARIDRFLQSRLDLSVRETKPTDTGVVTRDRLDEASASALSW